MYNIAISTYHEYNHLLSNQNKDIFDLGRNRIVA